MKDLPVITLDMAGPVFNHPDSVEYLRKYGVVDLRQVTKDLLEILRANGVPEDVCHDIENTKLVLCL